MQAQVVKCPQCGAEFVPNQREPARQPAPAPQQTPAVQDAEAQQLMDELMRSVGLAK